MEWSVFKSLKNPNFFFFFVNLKSNEIKCFQKKNLLLEEEALLKRV